MFEIAQQFNKLKKKNKLGLMTHVVCGFPQKNSTVELVLAMSKNDADFIELQIPFSDPSADGPTLTQANTIALKNRTSVKDCFEMAKKINKSAKTPLLFMTYLNIVFNYGIKNFIETASRSGISGMIIPDYPVEEASEYQKTCVRFGISPIFVISPNTSAERLKRIGDLASGFIYCTTRTGTTGVRDSLPSGLKSYLQNVKKIIKLPLAVGFGISKPQHIKALKLHADCAIVGSAIIDLLNKTKPNQQIEKVERFIQSLKSS